MKALHRRFIIQLLIVSAVLYIVFTKFIIASLPLLTMVSLLFAMNVLAFIIITGTKEKQSRKFVYIYMVASFGRLLICGAFVFTYALMHRQDARTFALTFFLLYFVYTLLEVRAVFNFFKR